MNPPPAFDRAAALERVGGDRDFLKELAGLFLAQSQEQLAQVVQAVARRDPEQVMRSAHTLKGSVANFNALPAQELAFRLECKGRAGTLDGVDQDLAELRHELARLEEALRALAAEP